MTHFLQRTALIALATGALGACSTTDTDALRPSYPVRIPDAAPPAATPASAPPPASAPVETTPITAAPAAPVEQRPLEPLAAPAPRPPAAAPAPRPAAPTPPPQPAYRNVTTRSVTGKVVEVEGPAVTYKVKKGDTLEAIAGRLDTTVSQLRDDNGIGKKDKIHPGDVLKGPPQSAHAYVAGQGDTLYSIGKRFGVTADALREANDLGRSASLRPGQKVRLPDSYRDRGPLTTTTRVALAQGTPAPLVDDEPSDVEEAPAERPRGQLTPPVQPAQAAYRTVTTRSVTGKVVEVEGKPVTYEVKKGDNLEKIARKLDTTVDQLRDDNGIGKRGAIQPGQTLKGPATTAKAYVAGQGDTLFSIAKRFGVTADALREANDLARNASLRPGQKIRLPDGFHDRGPLTTTTRVATAPPPAPAPLPVSQVTQPQTPAAPVPYTTAPSTTPASPVTPRPYTPPPRTYTPPTSSPAPYSPPRTYTPSPVTPRPYTPPPRTYSPPPGSQGPVAGPSVAPTPDDAKISELGRGRFTWPLQGPIVSDFGPKGPGQRNDGINIGAPLGVSIRAAAAGDVVYAGDQVPGFGNLVLIKHADGWVTAYGHLSRVMVKMQQKVTQGQEIGQAGATGGVSEPQLHFEVRYAPSPLERAKPVDPKLVLPK